MKKVIKDPVLGDIIYTKRIRCRSIRVKVSAASGISVSLPFWVTYATAQEFVESNRKKILSILARQKNSLPQPLQGNSNSTSSTDAPSVASSGASGTSSTSGVSGSSGTSAGHSVKMYSEAELAAIRKRAKQELPARLQLLAHKLQSKFPQYSFHYNKVFIKNNRTNWGSCSAKGNINLNMHLVNVPEELRDFVIIHELCHLVHRNHGAEFHKMVDLACGGMEKEYSRNLRKWSFLLHKIS